MQVIQDVKSSLPRHSSRLYGLVWDSEQVAPIQRSLLRASSKFTDSGHVLSRWARVTSDSMPISVLTTVLTLYALFGDDVRLLCTQKRYDFVFDFITYVAMATFSLEFCVSVAGKANYIWSFFFWLDLVSTCTLVLDITVVSEYLFGDSVSQATAADAQALQAAGGSNSQDAAYAARMSRAGTRAGRIVRLIRLVRLLRLLKLYKKTEQGFSHPGYDLIDIDDADNQAMKESAVSKKLSDMTTRRVIMIVLFILFVMPFFQTLMYGMNLEDSSVHGANVVFRRFCLDMRRFQPNLSAENRQKYMNSVERELYEDDFRLFIYYHNWFCKHTHYPLVHSSSSFTSFGKLFFAGVSPPWGNNTDLFLPYHRPAHMYDWNERWGGKEWEVGQCSINKDVQELLHWNKTKVCVQGTIRGVSMIQLSDSEVLCPSDIRWQERIVVYPTISVPGGCDGLIFVFVFDRRSGSMMEAALNIAQTFFICFLLAFFAMTFQGDAKELVLKPIERMIWKLEKIRSSPMAAALLGDAEQWREQLRIAASMPTEMESRDGTRRRTRCCCCFSWFCPRRLCCAWFCKLRARNRDGEAFEPEPMETVVLEKTILKIGSVLALGFGEAGVNMGQLLESHDLSALKFMVRGQTVEGLFCYCDIRNFWDALDVLDEHVMVFVNRIAEIVHSCSNDFYSGFVKNLGHAFVLAWTLSGRTPQKRQKLADMSVMALINIVARISKSRHLALYRSHAKFVKRLPNFRVRLSMGLHAGTAVATMLGSAFKVDAEYLSADVVMASRIAAVCAEYGMGCMILFTEDVESRLSRAMAAQCRLIDRVKLTNCNDPFKVYTVDLDDLALEVEEAPTGLVAPKSLRLSADQLNDKLERKRAKRIRWEDRFEMASIFTRDVDIFSMRLKINDAFLCRFHMAYLNYEAGEWKAAKDIFETTQFLLGRADGASSALLKFIKKYDSVAPWDWPGYRMLPSNY